MCCLNGVEVFILSLATGCLPSVGFPAVLARNASSLSISSHGTPQPVALLTRPLLPEEPRGCAALGRKIPSQALTIAGERHTFRRLTCYPRSRSQLPLQIIPWHTYLVALFATLLHEGSERRVKANTKCVALSSSCGGG